MKVRCRFAQGTTWLQINAVYTVVEMRNERWGIPSVRLAEVDGAWYGLDRFEGVAQ